MTEKKPLRRWRARAARLMLFLALGMGASIAVALAIFAIGLDSLIATPQTAEFTSGETAISVTRWERPGALAVEVDRTIGLSWSPRQATGPPDSVGPGDKPTAWATQAQDAPGEWLELDYPTAVIPAAVRVVETDKPGAVDRVTIFDAAGGEIEAWRGQDPTPVTAPMGTSDIPLATSAPTRRIRLYLASEKVPGWNEIDAVALVDRQGGVQWASDARASSFYGQSNAPNSTATSSLAVDQLIPAWSNLASPGPAITSGAAKSEQRGVDAVGWPFVCLWAPRRGLPAATPPGGASAPASSGSVWMTGSTLTPTDSIITPAPSSFSTTGSGTLIIGSRFVGSTPVVAASGNRAAAALSIRPIASGLMLDTLFYAAILVAGRWLTRTPARFIKELSRMRQGRCIRCGYDLGFDFLPGCPECGWRRGQGHRPVGPA